MERVGTLINKLKEQLEQQGGAEKMAATAHLLLAELQQATARQTVGSKVSVVLPAVNAPQPGGPEKSAAPKEDSSLNSWLFETPAEIPTIVHQAASKPAEVKTTPVSVRNLPEFNTVFAKPSESLNDTLKEEKLEVAAALQATPIRDLKKAIGVNDRFLFVNELFRGDENMYERSLKTINAFTIYPEAEYWIQRELKVKLSWPDNSETVTLFDQLVRRRFA